MNTLIKFSTALVVISVLSCVAVAQEGAKKKLPQEGILSSTARAGYSDKRVGGLWGDAFGQGGSSAAPISGSVSRVSPKEWLATVKNSSKDTVNISAQVIQYSANGSQVKVDSLSSTLQPSETFTRGFAASLTSTDATLKLTGWKLSGKKKQEEKK
jgi:hypothetical protein